MIQVSSASRGRRVGTGQTGAHWSSRPVQVPNAGTPAAETAQQTAEELGHRARIAEFQALAHSENPNVRTCCSSQAVQTLTSLSGFVREEKQNTSNDASLIGSPLKQSMPMPESPNCTMRVPRGT